MCEVYALSADTICVDCQERDHQLEINTGDKFIFNKKVGGYEREQIITVEPEMGSEGFEENKIILYVLETGGYFTEEEIIRLVRGEYISRIEVNTNIQNTA